MRVDLLFGGWRVSSFIVRAAGALLLHGFALFGLWCVLAVLRRAARLLLVAAPARLRFVQFDALRSFA